MSLQRAGCGGILALALLLASASLREAARAQMDPVNSVTAGRVVPPISDDDRQPVGASPAVLQRRMLLLEKARFRSMQVDADRLQRLAAQLAAERARDAGPYTPEQLRILQEIEKLAHRIRETMCAGPPADSAVRDLFPPLSGWR